jgi:hypothetical protein
MCEAEQLELAMEVQEQYMPVIDIRVDRSLPA